MKKIWKHITLAIIILLTLTTQAQECRTIRTEFQTYPQALLLIKSTDFEFTDSADTRKSDWIYGAEYYSCDGETGYFLITTAKKTYIHQGMPIRVWYEFKNAQSLGSYYSKRIRGNYQLRL